MGEMLKGDVHEQFTSTSAKLLTNVQSMKASPQKWAQHPKRRPQSLVEQVLGKSMSNAGVLPPKQTSYVEQQLL